MNEDGQKTPIVINKELKQKYTPEVRRFIKEAISNTWKRIKLRESVTGRIIPPDVRQDMLSIAKHTAFDTAVVEEAEKETHIQEARIDYVTGLYNQRGFNEALEKSVKRILTEQDKNGTPPPKSSCAVIDLNDFGPYNVRWGHLYGDAALLAVANATTEGIRPNDLTGRKGDRSDEITVVMIGATPEVAAEHFKKQIFPALAEKQKNMPEVITISVGIHEFDFHDIQNSIHQADIAMEAVKSQGKEAGTRHNNVVSISL
jgi:diguanylate cyclase (GGDEF)-like protein